MLHETSERYLMHWDVKPANFVMGMRQSSNTVHVIDFGLAKRYILDKKTLKHIPCTKNGMIGTARFASANAHQEMELSRRDDLESLGYMMIYFYLGKLPWENILSETIYSTFEKVGKMKLSISA